MQSLTDGHSIYGIPPAKPEKHICISCSLYWMMHPSIVFTLLGFFIFWFFRLRCCCCCCCRTWLLTFFAVIVGNDVLLVDAILKAFLDLHPRSCDTKFSAERVKSRSPWNSVRHFTANRKRLRNSLRQWCNNAFVLNSKYCRDNSKEEVITCDNGLC